MSDILRSHEGSITHQQFNAAEARQKFAERMGLPEAANRQHAEPDMSTRVAAAVIDEGGQVSDVQPVHLENEGGKSNILPVEVVEDKLKVEGLIQSGEQVVIFDLEKDKELLSGKFAVAPAKYSELPLAG